MEFLYRKILKIKSLKASRDLDIAIKNNIEVTKRNLSTLKEIGLEEFYSIPNLNLFSVLTVYDINTLINQFFETKQKNGKNIVVRVLAMIILEYIEVVNTLIGKNLLKDLNKINLEHYAIEYKLINKHFAQLKKVNENYLKTVRNTITAHRVNDAVKFTEIAENLDTDLIIRLALDLNSTITTLIALLTKTLNEITYNMLPIKKALLKKVRPM